jgi:hypothetical protein
MSHFTVGQVTSIQQGYTTMKCTVTEITASQITLESVNGKIITLPNKSPPRQAALSEDGKGNGL